MSSVTASYLAQKQSLPWQAKAVYTARRIIEFCDSTDDLAYVAFSGGLDSTVLLDIARTVRPDIPAVFIDTGVEYPEIREFIRATSDVTVVKPKKSFVEIVNTYGYPVISKEQSQFISEYRNTNSSTLRDLRWNGRGATGKSKISEKWKPLAMSEYKISDRCCHYLKKEPSKRYEKLTGRKPIVGTRADESSLRRSEYLKHGCNALQGSRIISRPMSIWTHEDVWNYINHKGIPYAKIYDMGYDRTGCYACGFGCHLNTPNKFQLMAKTHPKLHAHCMDTLGLRKIFSFIGVACD